MSEPGSAQTYPVPTRRPFPLERLLFALGFAIVAWFSLWILFFVSVVQFVVFAVNGHTNDELRSFSGRLVQYLWELLAFICFLRDERPFPFGPFPKPHV